MVGRVEGEPLLSRELASEAVFMRVIQDVESNSFDPKTFLKNAGILTKRGEANVTFNQTTGAPEMTDVLTYLRAVAAQHTPEIVDTANAPEMKQLPANQQKAATRTLILLTESEEDLKQNLKEIELRRVEMKIDDWFTMNGTLWDQNTPDSLLGPEVRQSIIQTIGNLTDEQFTAQLDAFVKANPTMTLKDAAGNPEDVKTTMTREQLKSYLALNRLDAFGFNYSLVNKAGEDIKKEVVRGTESIRLSEIEAAIEQNPLFPLQTGQGMLDPSSRIGKEKPIPKDTSDMLIEAIKALTPEQIISFLDSHPNHAVEILKIDPANLRYLKAATLRTLKEVADNLRFTLVGVQPPATEPAPQATATPRPPIETLPANIRVHLDSLRAANASQEQIDIALDQMLSQRRQIEAARAASTAQTPPNPPDANANQAPVQATEAQAAQPTQPQPATEANQIGETQPIITLTPHKRRPLVDRISSLFNRFKGKDQGQTNTPSPSVQPETAQNQQIEIFAPTPEEVQELAKNFWEKSGFSEEDRKSSENAKAGSILKAVESGEVFFNYRRALTEISDYDKEFFASEIELALRMGYEIGEFRINMTTGEVKATIAPTPEHLQNQQQVIDKVDTGLNQLNLPAEDLWKEWQEHKEEQERQNG